MGVYLKRFEKYFLTAREILKTSDQEFTQKWTNIKQKIWYWIFQGRSRFLNSEILNFKNFMKNP